MNKPIAVNINGAVFLYSSVSKADLNDEGYIHDDHEIVFVLSGRGVLTVEGQSFDISRGSLFTVPELMHHNVAFSSDNLEYYTVRFSPSAVLSEVYEHADAIFTAGVCRRYSFFNNAEGVFSLFERLSALGAMSSSERGLYFKMLLSELIMLIAMSRHDVFDDRECDLGTRVVRYLSDNIDKDISLDSLAHRFFVSKYYLCRAFKKRNGISPHSYITKKRVMYAKQLIEDGESASAAAYKVGFGDYSAFYRAYVKHLGSSPTSANSKEMHECVLDEYNSRV